MPETPDQNANDNAALTKPELVCPAGTPAMLRTAVDAGADAIYCGYRNATNARNFPGLNFSPKELGQSIAYAHDKGAQVLVAVNSFPPAGEMDLWKEGVDTAAELGADALIVADYGVAAYAAQTHPGLRLHLSVQGGASSPNAIKYFCREFGIRRVVLPRILTVEEIRGIHKQIPCEIEAFIFGNIGAMAEGRCSLSNYLTGVSSNMDGACSPASHVRYEEDPRGDLHIRLGGREIDRFTPGQTPGYPTICKGRYTTPCRDEPYYAFEEPVSLNLSRLLPDMMRAGVTALKIEGRQRSRAYVRDVVGAFRRAVDDIMAGRDPHLADLVALTEGGKETQGPFATKAWR